jgi:hypothetical protein
MSKRIGEKLRSPVKIKLEGCPEAKITEYRKNGRQHKIPLPFSTQDLGKDCHQDLSDPPYFMLELISRKCC